MSDNIEKYEEINHFTTAEKIEWFGYGEWVEEPDEILFEYLGFKCHIIRIVGKEPNGHIYGGNFCGYIQIPISHTQWKKNYEEIPIDVHGGLSFGEECKDDEYWIGFDCAHTHDVIPSMENMKKDMDKELIEKHGLKDSPIFQRSYKNMPYCIQECKFVVAQLSFLNNMQKEKDED